MEKASRTGSGTTAVLTRDRLAVDRTLLANERTFLAYVRLGVALVIAGLTIMNFAQQTWFWVVGVCCLPAGLLTVLIGLLRYRKMSSSISRFHRPE